MLTSHSVSHTLHLCALLPHSLPASSEDRLQHTRLLITPHHSTRGTRDHIAFLCYHPLASPAPHNLCRAPRTCSLPPQVLPAHTGVCVVTQSLSINTPSMKKSSVQCHRSLPLHGFLQQYFIMLLTDTSHSRLGKQQRRQGTCCSAGTQSMHILSLPSFMYDIKFVSLHHTVLTWVE